MTNIKHHINFFAGLLILRAMDLYLTYKITPDLTQEWNPLVSYFNMSWQGFMLIQLMLVLVGLVAFHRYSQRMKKPVDKPGLPMYRYIFYYFNACDLSWKNWLHSFVRIPNKLYFRKSSAFCGFSIAASFVLVSLFAIIHNILILGDYPAYNQFLFEYNKIYVPSVYLSLVLSSCLAFFMIEYKRYKSEYTSGNILRPHAIKLRSYNTL